MRVLLLTNNVRSVFDALDERLEWFLNVLDDTVTGAAADFVALHLQELSGQTDGSQETGGVEPMRFSEAMRARFPDYWSSGIICSTVSDRDFTALACLVLVRRSVAKDVAVFDFGADPMGGWRTVAALADPLVPDPSLPRRWARHSCFPHQLLDSLGGERNGRGWLHTRWRVAGQPLELLNVHLSDDANHLLALRRDTPTSSYARSRHEALQHALDSLTAAGPAPAALGPRPSALCVFGALNFQLDVHCVLTQLAGEREVARALAAAAAPDSAVHVALPPLPLPGSAATRRATAAPASVDSSSSGPLGAWWLAPCRCLASLTPGPPREASVDAERFVIDDAAAIFGGGPSAAIRACDLELAACRDLAPALSELEVAFPPTSPYLQGAASSAARPAYSSYHCPSWSDRVLLDAVGVRLMRAAGDVVYGAHEQEVIVNDHSMVHLAFTLGPGVAQGLHEIPVRVQADAAAPVPLKVKCVAVGAG